jgi:hypothetical protein
VPPAVDHAVVNVLRDMDAAARRFAALGFTLTPRGHHSLGSINHLMVFDRDYLELVGLPLGDGPVRREVAESPAGLNGLVFATADADALHRDLAGRGIPAQPPLAFDRPVDVDGTSRRASFRTVRLDPAWVRGGRVYFCQHQTPELVWRAPWQAHANAVHALGGMTIAVTDPSREAQRYRALGGVAAGAAHAGGAAEGGEQVVAFGDFAVRLVTPAAYVAQYGRLGCDPGGRDAFMGALELRTRALERVRACLAAAGLSGDTRQAATRITLAAASAFNAVIEFADSPALPQ